MGSVLLSCCFLVDIHLQCKRVPGYRVSDKSDFPLARKVKNSSQGVLIQFYNRRGVCFVDGLGRWLLITYVLLSYQAASFAWQDQITEVYSDALLMLHELHG